MPPRSSLGDPLHGAAPWPTTTRTVLPSGLTVVTTPLPHLHTVALSVEVGVGSRYETKRTSGLSHLVEHGLFRGCAALPSAVELNAALESVSTGLDAATYRDFTVFEATARPEDLGSALELVGAVLSRPTFEDLAAERRIIGEELRDEVDERGRDVDVDNVARRARFGERGLGLKVGGLPKVIADLTEGRCRAWHAAHYRPGNMAVAVAGPVTHAKVVELVAAAFQALPPGGAVPLPPSPVEARVPPLVYVASRGSQASLQLSWTAPGPGARDALALEWAVRLLDDGTAARLRREVVDERSLAYDVSTLMEAHDDVGLLLVDAACSPDNALEVARTSLVSLASLASGGPDASEWRRVRERFALRWEALRDHPEAVAAWASHQARHAPHHTLADRWGAALSVRRDDVARALGEVLASAPPLIAVVGELSPLDRAALRRAVRARPASLGPSRLRPPSREGLDERQKKS